MAPKPLPDHPIDHEPLFDRVPKPLPDHPVILEDLSREARRYLDDFGPIADKLSSLEQKKLDDDASPVRSPWDLDYQKALIDDIFKRLAASSGRPIALLDYIESDIFADMADIRLRMGGVDPNSNPSMTALLLFQQTLDKVRDLYRKIIAKLENQKAASPTALLIPDTPRRRSPAVGPEGDTKSSDAPTDRSHQGFMAIETSPLAETISKLKGCRLQVEIVRYLGARQHDGFTPLDQVAIDVFKVGQARLRSKEKTVRRQLERTRDNLVQKDCPLRLDISGNTVRLNPVPRSEGLADSKK